MKKYLAIMALTVAIPAYADIQCVQSVCTVTDEKTITQVIDLNELVSKNKYERQLINERTEEIARDTVRYVDEPTAKNVASEAEIAKRVALIAQLTAAGGIVSEEPVDEIVSGYAAE